MGQPHQGTAGQDGHRAAQAQVVTELAIGDGLDPTDAQPLDGEERRYRRDAVILLLEGRRRRRGPRT